jgi:hypothetical protein
LHEPESQRKIYERVTIFKEARTSVDDDDDDDDHHHHHHHHHLDHRLL